MRSRSILYAAALVTVAGSVLTVHADRIVTRTELDGILSGSEEYLEDFEEVSFHSGTFMNLPNPFNHVTGTPFGWGGLIPGATYSSSGNLAMYAWFLYGDDSNILTGTGDITVTFDEPQLAVGLDVDGGSTEILHQTLTVYHGENVIDTWEFDMNPSTTLFVGWQNPQGITSLKIATSAGSTEIDNVAWGVVITDPCAADMNGTGTVDFADLLSLLASWGSCECTADLNGDDEVDFADLLILLASWGPCP